MNTIKLIPGGQCLSTLENGKKAFLWNALPEEEVVSFEVTKEKSHYLEAIATKITKQSPHRILPKDPCYLATSPWQIMDYDFELIAKRELLIENFRQAGIENLNPEQVQTDGKDFFYRNKMEYALYYNFESAQIELAMRHRGTHRKFPIYQSSIERPEIFATAQTIVAKMNLEGERAGDYQSLLLRTNQSGQVSGGLLRNHQPHPVFSPLKDTILGKEYTYSPNGFFQINLPVYEMALKEIKKHISTSKVLDLYAGVGTIGLSVANDKELTLVELNASAYRELENNCKGTDAKPLLLKSEEALAYIEPDQTVILDPPRAGCDKTLIEKLLDTNPEKIIYLSCNPATQARDVALLLEKYHLEKVVPFNFFPRTPHLENLIILSK